MTQVTLIIPRGGSDTRLWLLSRFRFTKQFLLLSGIDELAHAFAKATSYQANISFDPSKPDSSLRKWVSSERLNELGWQSRVEIKDGLNLTYQDLLKGLHLV